MQKVRPILYAYGAVVIWSAAYVATKIGLQYYDPISLSILRYLVAGIFAVTLVIVRHEHLPKRRDIPLFLLLGITGYSLYVLTYNLGAKDVSVSAASIIISLAPISTAIGASVIWAERLSARQTVAALIEFAGAAIVCLSGDVLKAGNGMLWIIASLLSFTAYNLLTRFAVEKYSAIQITEYGLIVALITFLPASPYAFLQNEENSVAGLSSILFMGVICTGMAYILWSKAMESTDGTVNVTNALFLEPIVATLLGIVVLKEYPSGWIWAGIAINCIGLWIFYGG